MWNEVRPGNYVQKIQTDALVRVFMVALLHRFSGLREIAEKLGKTLGTTNFSSLSHALARESSLAYARGLVERLGQRGSSLAGRLVAIDSMAMCVPATQRHDCEKLNRKTAGGGVMWSFDIECAPGICPVRILKLMTKGAWNDSAQIRGVELERGPIYLMDRGFFALPLISDWLAGGVRFIMRSRAKVGVEALRQTGKPRDYVSGNKTRGRILFDGVARLGAPRARAHPEVRYVQARIGEMTLTLVSGERDWTAERILDAYAKRQRIEQFHRFVKETVGLAHLYSFSRVGIMFLLHVATLVSALLILGDEAARGDTAKRLREILQQIRNALGLAYVWKRNTHVARRQNKNQSVANP